MAVRTITRKNASLPDSFIAIKTLDGIKGWKPVTKGGSLAATSKLSPLLEKMFSSNRLNLKTNKPVATRGLCLVDMCSV